MIVDSDYGSMNSFTSWSSQELEGQTFQPQNAERTRAKAASYADLMSGRCNIDDVMQDFRMNGSDAPYSPDDDDLWRHTTAPAYRRQVSWPAAAASERRGRPRAVRPISACYLPARVDAGTDVAAAGTTPPPALLSHPTASAPTLLPNAGGNDAWSVPPMPAAAPASTAAPLAGLALTAAQRRVLSSLPDAAVIALLREMQRLNKRPHPHPRQCEVQECRFCKNNGERECYYRGHVLKDAQGRVQCPVLRAFVCKRCGASGDRAHTLKYCHLSTSEERIKSAAMMRSMRMASGRRRTLTPSSGSGDNYVVFGETPSSGDGDNYMVFGETPSVGGGDNYAVFGQMPAYAERSPATAPAVLDPLWTALEQKLMLS